MCRLFASVSQRPHRTTEALRGLQLLSREHKDGWGIAWYDGDHPTVERGLAPAYASGRFHEISSLMQSTCVVAHVRLASVGEVKIENTHPFSWQRWTACHNGTLPLFLESPGRYDDALPLPWRSRIAGQTDSERMFWTLMSQLESERSPTAEAVARAVARLIWETVEHHGEATAAPPSLNFVVTDGRTLVASRSGRSLYYAVADGSATIASEPMWDGQSWYPVDDHHLVVVEAGCVANVKPISYFL